MSFKDAVLNTQVETQTTNLMWAFESTLSNNVDMFFKIGASRGCNITPMFEAAYQENPDRALRIVQWARDVRGGAGERDLFRQVLKYMEFQHKSDLLNTRLMQNVAEIGRWDDLLIFSDIDVKEKAYSLIKIALQNKDGLCAKWMPRKGPIAADLREFLQYSPKQYRKTLVNLTKVVETQMCAKEWDDINYSHVPSLAMSRYAKAFGRHSPVAFGAYKEALASGDPSVKVNVGAVYPYDITKSLRYGDAKLADSQWAALPNYMGDAKVLPLVDVSGSMTSAVGGGSKGVQLTCLDVAVSLGLYCSDKNTGAFKDLFLTFSKNPQFVHLKGTLSQKKVQMDESDWDMNTDLEGAFCEILRVATINKVPAEDMPDVLLIMSDMQFDQACHHKSDSAMDMIARNYESNGYKTPAIVFWNLNSHDNVPVKFDDRGTALVSGFSPSILKAVLSMDTSAMTPQGIMLNAIMSPRYDLHMVG